MKDKFQLAREVFAAFIEGYEVHQDRPHVQWWLSLANIESELSLGELRSGAAVLVQKRLLDCRTTDSFGLTDLGKEVCLHPECLDEHLKPRGLPAPQIITFNAEYMQVGDNNVQNVTYSIVLAALARELESAPDIPEPEKRQWLDVLKRVAEHPLTQTVIGAAAAAATR